MTTSGVFTAYAVTSSIYPNILGITVGPDGALWFAEHQGNKIGRIDVAGNITEFGPVNEPHTIGAGPDGNLWFTMPASHTIGRITPMGTITLFRLPMRCAAGAWRSTLLPPATPNRAPVLPMLMLWALSYPADVTVHMNNVRCTRMTKWAGGTSLPRS
jgi:streptogramin lyase